MIASTFETRNVIVKDNHSGQQRFFPQNILPNDAKFWKHHSSIGNGCSDILNIWKGPPQRNKPIFYIFLKYGYMKRFISRWTLRWLPNAFDIITVAMKKMRRSNILEWPPRRDGAWYIWPWYILSPADVWHCISSTNTDQKGGKP